MGKIAFLNAGKIDPRALLASVSEQEELDGVVLVVRRAGRWQTCWSSGLNLGGLCMAAKVLDNDVTSFLYEGATANDEPDNAA